MSFNLLIIISNKLWLASLRQLSKMTKYRKASHAGSWYKSSGKELNKELSGWLNDAPISHHPARAIIGPHAGYSYSGPCAAHAYKQIDPSTVKRIFLLGPSHHVHLDGCALSAVQYYSTPLYDIPIDTDVCNDLNKTGQFELMSLETDEDEHSLEMHLPYIAKVMEDYQKQYKLIPILVGSLTFKSEQLYGQILAPYLKDSNTLFVISSDFCHWGSRFRYTYQDEGTSEIWESIQKLDKKGMSIIESLDHRKFNEYLKEYRNTICGRHPIGVLLAALEILDAQKKGYKFSMKFVQYAQSNKCRSMQDSSVSYASGVLRID